MRKKLTELLQGRSSGCECEEAGATEGVRLGRSQTENAEHLSKDTALGRRRAHSEYVESRTARKRKQSVDSSDRGRGRARTVSSWTPPANVGWMVRRKSSVHAVDFGVLQSSYLPDHDDSPDTLQTTAQSEQNVCEEEQTCLICMGRASKKRPLVNIPCKNECNLAPVHSKCIYEWKAQKKGHGTCPLCRGALGDIDYTPPDLLRVAELKNFNARKRFVQSPVPKAAGTVRCYLKVRSGFWGSPARYEMYLQAPSSTAYPGGPLPDEKSPKEGDVLLMAAKKTLNRWGCSRINVSMDVDCKDFDKKSKNYLGQVQADFAGLAHTISVPYRTNVHGSNAGGHLEIGAIQFSQNRVGSASGPRRLQCILPVVEQIDSELNSCCSDSTINSEAAGEPEPHVDPTSIAIVSSSVEEDNLSYESDDEEIETKRYATKNYRPSSKFDTLSTILKKHSTNLRGVDDSQFITGQNKEPYWLETIHAYSLDFGGRVTLPSNKNFQLELTHRVSDEISLQFGKVATCTDDESTSIYTLDFTFPLSPLQALGFALCSCDRKLACA